ncbi:hypothetical protein ACFL2K_04595, partial [Candidatus Margulisiibacteriota bacterium]
MKKIIIFLIICMTISVALFGADQFDMITQVGTNAKMIGIGNIEGQTQSSSVLFENPASLYYIDNTSFSFFSASFLNQVNYTNFTVGMATEYGNFAIGVMRLSSPDLPITQEDENNEFVTIGSFEYLHQIIGMAYQFEIIKQLYIGATLKHFSHDIHTVTGSGVNADLGLYWDRGPVNLSLTLKNIVPFSKVQYSTGTSEDIPMQIVLSTKYDLEKSRDFYLKGMEVFAQIKMLPVSTDAGPLYFSIGARYNPPILEDVFYFSGGYKQVPVAGTVKATAVAGLGMKFWNTEFNFAFEPSDYFQNYNKYYFSISIDVTAEKAPIPEEEKKKERFEFGYTREEVLQQAQEQKEKIEPKVEPKKEIVPEIKEPEPVVVEEKVIEKPEIAAIKEEVKPEVEEEIVPEVKEPEPVVVEEKVIEKPEIAAVKEEVKPEVEKEIV